MITRLLLLFALLLLAAPAAAQQIVYVNHAASGIGDGTSWTNAFTDLQAALASATPGTRIFVAGGTYFPTAGASRSESFHLKTGVEVYGGFSGTETALQQRDWRQHETILSGDIGAPGQAADNSYHVVVGSGTDSTAVLDGFIVERGNANGNPEPLGDAGGGMFNRNGSPTVSNVIFRDNFAPNGAGVMNRDGASPSFVNVLFHGNLAGNNGGAVGVAGPGSARFVNCTFSANVALAGGAMYVSGGTVQIRNSILWQNQGGQVALAAGGSVSISHAIVQGGYQGGTNVLNQDPRFAAPGAGDFRLTVNSPAVDVGQTAFLPRDWRDLDGDGNTAEPIPFDLAQQPRIWGAGLDLGAFEFAATECPVGVIRVKAGAIGTGDGSSWENAYPDLGSALRQVGGCPGLSEIWVAAGTYTPTLDGSPTEVMRMRSGLAIYGGFAGIEVVREERDWEANPTIISGYLSPTSSSRTAVLAEAVDSTAVLDGLILTGMQLMAMSIVNGNPTLAHMQFVDNAGSGLRITNGSPVVSHSLFRNNSASSGGGIYHSGGNPRLHHVTFEANQATAYFSGGGGGVYSAGGSIYLSDCLFITNGAPAGGAGGALMLYDGRARIERCVFEDNRGVRLGMGIHNHAGDITITDTEFVRNGRQGTQALNARGGGLSSAGGLVVMDRVLFRENRVHAPDTAGGAGIAILGGEARLQNMTFAYNSVLGMREPFSGHGMGGGLLVEAGTVRLVNALFHDNSASGSNYGSGHLFFYGSGSGGGVSTTSEADVVITNATITANSGFHGDPAIQNQGGGLNVGTSTTIRNSIIWQNQRGNIAGSPVVEHSLVQGGYSGTAVLNADPLFVEADARNYRLNQGSPAIDFGSNAFLPDSITVDLDGNPRIQGAAVDLGAYESPFTVSTEPVSELPLTTELGEAYPNPFSTSATFAVSLASPARVQVTLYDVLGRRVAVLRDEHLAAGRYAVPLNAASLSSGTYLVRMEAGDTVQTRRVVLVR